MTNDELDELIGVAKLIKRYAYAHIGTSSTTCINPRPQILLLCTVPSPTDQLLAWAGMVPAKGVNVGST